MLSMRVLVLLALLVGFAHCFQWDIVQGGDKQLEFYHHGTLTHTEVIPSAHYMTSVTYDPVHYRRLFTDYYYPTMSISSFDLSTRKIQPLVTRPSNGDFLRVVYDPVTQSLYWKDLSTIYSFSLNPASFNKADGNLLVTMGHQCRDLAVDGSGRYIYWITDHEIERARLDGSEREVLIASTVSIRLSLAIDLQTQTIYWTERTRSGDEHCSLESANFSGKNRTTLYVVRNVPYAFSLTVSKDLIYWQNYNQEGIWQLPKNQISRQATKLYSMSSSNCVLCHRIAANHTLEEQSLIPNNANSESTVSLCQNYCFQGECGVSAEGRPACSCKAGYSGERCEVSACHKHCLNGGVCSLNMEVEPVCQCTAGYDGERCEYSICNEYCLQGNCSVDVDGLPKCSCSTGYSGERCEENACHKHCLNGGVCSLNEEDEPACQCTAGYDGRRCEVFANKDNSCDADNSGEVTVSACRWFCLNNGVCSLNEASEPVCQCTADYEGDRCDVPTFVLKWFLNAYKNVPPVALSEAVKSTRASTVV